MMVKSNQYLKTNNPKSLPTLYVLANSKSKHSKTFPKLQVSSPNVT